MQRKRSSSYVLTHGKLKVSHVFRSKDSAQKYTLRDGEHVIIYQVTIILVVTDDCKLCEAYRIL